MRYPAIGGTRFRLYPSYAEGFAEPEVVEVSLPAGTVRAGPSDHSMCVVNPVRKDEPYDPPHYVPPYRGPVYAPALPGPDGHFDHIPVETEQFLAAHLYGTVRWTLDIWEHYLRRRGRLVGRRCPSAVGAHPDRALAECAVGAWLPGDRSQAEPDGSVRSRSASITISWRTKPGIRFCSPRSACRSPTRSACRFWHFTNRSPIWWH